MNIQRTLKITIFLLAASSLVGCQSLFDGKRWFAKEKELETKTPSKMVAIWTNSVLNEAGKRPVRGLGGRVYFYDAEHRPVPVDGQFSVFVYDDTDPDSVQRQEASKRVNFTPTEVASHYTPSKFGSSYSFWVPWDEVGGESKKLSVIPVFTDSKGRMLVGDQARHVLPGRLALAETKSGGVAPASFESSATSDQSESSSTKVKLEEDGSRVITSTIKLPPTMQKRLRGRVRKSPKPDANPTSAEPDAQNVEPKTSEVQQPTVETQNVEELQKQDEYGFTASRLTRSSLRRRPAPASRSEQRDPFRVPIQPFPGVSPFSR